MADDTVKVKVIHRNGEATLVEWVEGDGTRRVTVPAGVTAGGRVKRDELDYGIPYGAPWEDLVEIDATPERIAAELRRCGIWTYEDLLARPEQVRGIQASVGFDVAALFRAAREAVKSGGK